MCNLSKASHIEESVNGFLAEMLSSFFVFCSAVNKELWTQEIINPPRLLLKDLFQQHSQGPSTLGKCRTAIVLSTAHWDP